MMEQQDPSQVRLMIVDLEQYVPQDHLLGKIKAKVDFSFIYDRVRHLYAEGGRPSVDPVLLVKMLLIGYLYGIPSERKLEQEIHLNLAYRWFLGLQLDERPPDHSTLSQNRRRRFKGTAVFLGIFDGIVEQCIAAGIVGGRTVVSDATHVKANASLDRVQTVTVPKTPRAYLVELEAEARRVSEERRSRLGGAKRGRKPKPRDETRTVKMSTTDPDAGMLTRPGKPGGFHYLSHLTLDTERGVIMDAYVTPANVNDHEPYVERLRRVKERFRLPMQEAAADRGYDQMDVHKGLHDLGITGYIPHYERYSGSEDRISIREFTYDPGQDLYRCPGGRELRFSYIDERQLRRVYVSRDADCQCCLLKHRCVPRSARHRSVMRSLHQDYADKAYERVGTERYYELQRLRHIWCEGTIAIMKDRHCLRRALRRGIWNATEQILLTAVAVNIKRLVTFLERHARLLRLRPTELASGVCLG